jgi:phage terminase small subunit
MSDGNERPEPPEHLTERSKELWRESQAERQWSTGKLTLLAQALESLDRADMAAEIVRREGIVITGGKMPHAHPATKIEKDARSQFAMIWKELDCGRLF